MIDLQLTAIKSWQEKAPEISDEQWVPCIQRTYKMTRDNKLRHFNFKLLYRIPVTNEED